MYNVLVDLETWTWASNYFSKSWFGQLNECNNSIHFIRIWKLNEKTHIRLLVYRKDSINVGYYYTYYLGGYDIICKYSPSVSSWTTLFLLQFNSHQSFKKKKNTNHIFLFIILKSSSNCYVLTVYISSCSWYPDVAKSCISCRTVILKTQFQYFNSFKKKRYRLNHCTIGR